MSKSSNSHQVGGAHYRTLIQHWDYVWANNLDYFQGQIIKYVTRWNKKNGIEDLKKARHFLDKYIELLENSAGGPGADDTPPERIPENIELVGAVGTDGSRYIFRCTDCGFRITAHDWREFKDLHGACPHRQADMAQTEYYVEPKGA